MDLEQMIDATSLEDVIEALAQICHEKADHVQSTWQDSNLAKQWTKRAQKLEKVQGQIESIPVS